MTMKMMTTAGAKRTRQRNHVSGQQLPVLCWWFVIGTILLSCCHITHAINSNESTRKPILNTATALNETNTTPISASTATINISTKAFETEIHFAATHEPLNNGVVAIAAASGKIQEIEKQSDVTNKSLLHAQENKSSALMPWHKWSEKLIVWPNTTIEWLNLTDVVKATTTDHGASGSGSSSGSIFSTTLSLNHTDHNLFTFHEDCLANSNTLSHICTIVLYTVVCVVGLFGNTLVIWVVLRFSKMQTVTNIYILNLAIADECFLIGIPFLLYTMRICGWKFGDYMCKAYMVSTSITQFTSSIFLLIMAADRYIAVCHPIESPKYRTLRNAKLVSIVAWFTSAVLMLPVILFASTVLQEDGINFSCNIDWPEVYKKHSGTTFILYTFLLGFATPLCFILVFYYLVIRKLHSLQQKHKSKEKKRSHRKVTRLVLTVITVYILCWLPHWISQVSLISAFVGQRELSRFEILLFLLFGCLAYSNSAMNPILYAFLSDNFRKSFTRAFTCMNRHEVEAQLINEHSVFMHKRTGSGSKRGNSKHLTVPRGNVANNPENSSFLAPTTVHHSGGVGEGSSSATSTSTATTATDKSSNVTKKPTEQLNGEVLLVTTPNTDEEHIHMVVSHDRRSQGFKTALCHVETDSQTNV